MAFADWMKRSKIFTATQRRLNCYSPITDLCRAAYKAGERDGRKQVEAVAENCVGLAVLAEREVCANICDHEQGTAGDAAEKIRMRSNVDLTGSGEGEHK